MDESSSPTQNYLRTSHTKHDRQNMDESSSPTQNYPKNDHTNHDRQNMDATQNYPKTYDRRRSYNNYNNNHNNYAHSYNFSENDDWKFFIWIASFNRFENYTCLFILIWDNTRLDYADRSDRSEEFNDEIGQMRGYIEDLFTNKAIDKQVLEKYSSLLDDYRNCRYNDPESRRNIVSRAFGNLEKCGLLKNYSYENQLNRLRYPQQKRVRQMIIDRMKSFVDISGQSLTANSKEIESLREQNIILAQENSHYQAALGNMTNTRLDDQDPNNATILSSDIKELQHLIEQFTIVNGSEYEINEEKSTELLSQYTQNNYQLASAKAKLILGGILQQLIITEILDSVKLYFNSSIEDRNPNDTIEVDILNKTERLMQSFNNFNEQRPGNDDITQAAKTKVRQQVYAALGCRGFSNDNHPLIVETAKKICELMNKYRKITDSDMLNEIDDQSIQITRKVISIFYFRLKTQQNIPTHRFYRCGERINTRLMQVSSREEARQLEVEVCYFPCIGVFDDNNSNQQIFTKAQVYTRHRKQRNSTNGSGGTSSTSKFTRGKK